MAIPPAVQSVAWAVTHAARLVPGASCLTQALAAKQLLGNRGIPSRLRIGVARGDEERCGARVAGVRGHHHPRAGGTRVPPTAVSSQRPCEPRV